MISIVIPTYGRPDLLSQCLEALARNTVVPHETIVVDDGQGLSVADVVMVKHERNKGFASAINSGIRQAKGEHIFLVNSDAFVHSYCLEHMDYALTYYGDIVGAKLLYPNGNIQHAGITYMGNYYFYHNVSDPYKGRPMHSLVTGALVGIRRAAFDTIGYFDETFFVAYEDIDFCFRALKAGLKVVYWPDATATHLEGATRGRTPEEKLRLNPKAAAEEERGRRYFMSKYTDEEVRELCKPFPLS